MSHLISESSRACLRTQAARGICFSFLLLATLLIPFHAPAQVITGTPPFGSFSGGPEIINTDTLNAHLAIPVIHKAGRAGHNFTYDLSYDSSVWYPVTSGSTKTWQSVGNWGWRGQTEAVTGYTSGSQSITGTCMTCNSFYCTTTGWAYTVANWAYHDYFGTVHPFSGSATYYAGTCTGTASGFTSTATDGSGYKLTVTAANNSGITSAVVTARDGTVENGPFNSGSGAGSGVDRNGNQITVSGSTFTDTLGTTALTVAGSGTPASPMTFTYTPAAGGSAAYTVKYTAYTVQTNFACSGVAEYGPTANNLISEIDLPDSSKYTFTYEPTPGFSGKVTGRLASVTLPTGGTINYTYTGGSSGHITCTDGSASGMTRQTPDGTWTYTRTAGSGAAYTTKVTDPQGNDTSIQFQGIYETQRIAYQGSSTSGTILQTTNTCYNGAASPCTGTAITLPITQRSITNQLGASGPTNKTVFTYNNFGLMTEEDDYDFPSGTSLLKKTLITFANLGNNLNAFRQTVTVQDGSGNIKFRQDTNYDQTTPTCVTGAPQHDDSGHGCSFNSRANATSVTTYINPAAPSGGITQTLTYDTLGNLRTAKDALNNTTTVAYSPDAWGNTACPPSATTYAFPVSASNALSQTTNFTYFNCTGQLASVKDPNNQTTSIAYDSLLRPTQTNFPDGGQTSWTYNSQTSITATTKMNSTQNIVSTTLLDGLGRTSQTQLNSDPQGVNYTATTYDALGRLASVYNPTYCNPPTTNCGFSVWGNYPWGFTSYSYDALGRPTSVTLQDGSVLSAVYSGNTITVTDPAVKKRSSTIDGLGRLSQVTEDPSGLGYATTYVYDVFGNITGVTQNGGRQRTYVYDALSRLTSETNPESGATNYYFTTSGGALCSGSASQVCRRTDARNITTTYSFDALNRLTQKSYSDGTTLTAYFAYDMNTAWGVIPLTNTTGRLTESSVGTQCCAQAATIFSYDPMGRILTNNQCTPLNCAQTGFSVQYTHNLAGAIATYTDGVGETYTQSFDTAGKLSRL